MDTLAIGRLDSALERSGALEIRAQRPQNLVFNPAYFKHSGDSGNTLYLYLQPKKNWRRETRAP